MHACWVHPTSSPLRPFLPLLYLQSGSTSDDIDELVGDSGLATTVVLHLQAGDHVGGVLGCVIHGLLPGGLLAGVALDEGGEDGVGKGELGKILGGVVLIFIGLEGVYVTRQINHLPRRAVEARTRGSQSLGTLNNHGSGLVGDGRLELVVNEDNRVVLDTTLGDEIRNGSSVRKGRDITPDLVEGHGEVVSVNAGELHLGLVADDGNGGGGVDGLVVAGEGGVGVVGEGAAGGFGDGGVDTAAKTLVGGDDDEELVAAGLVVGVLEDL